MTTRAAFLQCTLPLLVLCRFLDAGMTPLPRAVAVGVQKAPRHEVAGSLALAVPRALWGFDGGAQLEVDVTPTGCGRRISPLARLEAYNRHLGKRLNGLKSARHVDRVDRVERDRCRRGASASERGNGDAQGHFRVSPLIVSMMLKIGPSPTPATPGSHGLDARRSTHVAPGARAA